MGGLEKVQIWDDGSTNARMIDSLRRAAGECVVHFEPHLGYREQFVRIGEHARAEGHEFYVYIEDDVAFCIDWYEYAMKKLKQMLDAGLNVGVYAIYTGHPAIAKRVLPNVYEHRGEHFYGTCALVINTQFVEELCCCIEDRKLNPDIAILELLGCKQHPKFNLYVNIPTLAQHVGKVTRLNAPFHSSQKFLGMAVNALEVLL
jgi:hypothetical protein